jgi:hypothetical protein
MAHAAASSESPPAKAGAIIPDDGLIVALLAELLVRAYVRRQRAARGAPSAEPRCGGCVWPA